MEPPTVRPENSSEALGAETRTNGPAGKLSEMSWPSRLALRSTDVARVFNSTRTVLKVTMTPGTLKAEDPTVRIPSVPLGSAIRLPFAPVILTRLEPLLVKERLAEMTSMESPPLSRVSKEKVPSRDCSPTISWAFTPITFATGPARIWIERVTAPTVTVSLTAVGMLLTRTRKVPVAERCGRRTESSPEISKAEPSAVATTAPIPSSIRR